jgi:hypothetical protein
MVMVGVKQHKACTPQRRKWNLTWKVYILLPGRPNFIIKSMVEINPSSIGRPRSIDVWWLKKVQLPHDWWRMLSITKLVMTKSILSPNVWSWKNFNCHTIGNEKISVFVGLAIDFFCHQTFNNQKKFVAKSFMVI